MFGMTNKNLNLLIVGAGLAGTMLAIYLAKRGYKVKVFEKRSHPFSKSSIQDEGKAASVDLSFRGLRALSEIGLYEKVMSHAMPMKGQCIYIGSNTTRLPFGKDNQEIYAVSRLKIFKDLVKEAESHRLISIDFDQEFLDCDLYKQCAAFQNRNNNQVHEIPFDILIGADGVNSAVRSSIKDEIEVPFNVEDNFHYKEFSITKSLSNVLEKQSTHMWPREHCLFVAHPDFEGGFSGTFLCPKNKNKKFEHLSNLDRSSVLFKEKYPDISELFPKFIHEFKVNTLGLIRSIYLGKWWVRRKVLLIGDSAHAMVPYFGQGMNCAFEDCFYINKLLDLHNDNWVEVINKFEMNRKENTTAITEMSLENCPGWTTEA